MKKLLSIVLAATMLAAVSVPSFAATAEINQDTAGGKVSQPLRPIQQTFPQTVISQ